MKTFHCILFATAIVTRPLCLVESHMLDAAARRERSLYTQHMLLLLLLFYIWFNCLIFIYACSLSQRHESEWLFWQVSTCAGVNQLPIICCTNVHLWRDARSLIFACRLRSSHESVWDHNKILYLILQNVPTFSFVEHRSKIFIDPWWRRDEFVEKATQVKKLCNYISGFTWLMHVFYIQGMLTL